MVPNFKTNLVDDGGIVGNKQKAMKSIKEYLPKKNEEYTATTIRLPRALMKQVKGIADKEGLTFISVIEACLHHFVDEMNQKKSA